jgi:hypothetical protein
MRLEVRIGRRGRARAPQGLRDVLHGLLVPAVPDHAPGHRVAGERFDVAAKFLRGDLPDRLFRGGGERWRFCGERCDPGGDQKEREQTTLDEHDRSRSYHGYRSRAASVITKRLTPARRHEGTKARRHEKQNQKLRVFASSRLRERRSRPSVGAFSGVAYVFRSVGTWLVNAWQHSPPDFLLVVAVIAAEGVEQSAFLPGNGDC